MSKTAVLTVKTGKDFLKDHSCSLSSMPVRKDQNKDFFTQVNKVIDHFDDSFTAGTRASKDHSSAKYMKELGVSMAAVYVAAQYRNIPIKWANTKQHDDGFNLALKNKKRSK